MKLSKTGVLLGGDMVIFIFETGPSKCNIHYAEFNSESEKSHCYGVVILKYSSSMASKVIFFHTRDGSEGERHT